MVTDTKGFIEYVNPKFCQVSGYEAQEVLGQNPRILKSGETSAEEYKKLWATISSGGEWRGELHNRKKSGELYWELASISPIRDQEGRTTHYLAVKEDITVRKETELRLNETTTYLKLLIDAMPGVFFVVDRCANIVRWNQALLDVTGYSDEEIKSVNGIDIMSDAYKAVAI